MRRAGYPPQSRRGRGEKRKPKARGAEPPEPPRSGASAAAKPAAASAQLPALRVARGRNFNSSPCFPLRPACGDIAAFRCLPLGGGLLALYLSTISETALPIGLNPVPGAQMRAVRFSKHRSSTGNRTPGTGLFPKRGYIDGQPVNMWCSQIPAISARKRLEQ